jgi:hypothetical protein
MGATLFHRLIGPAFEALPVPLRALHAASEARTYNGRCDVTRGSGLLSRIFGAIASLPTAGNGVPLRVTIIPDARGETWEQTFARKTLRSRLRDRDGLLEETLGPTTFRYALATGPDCIDWKLVGVRSLGVPLPLAWFSVSSREALDGGLYGFEVRVQMPLVGLLVHYRGTLDS